MSYYFSEKECGFYCEEVNDTVPDGAVEISDERYYSLLEGQSRGMLITADAKGNPILVEQPAPTIEQLIASAQVKKSGLMLFVNNAIVPLQDAEDLNLATDEEKQRLLTLKKYRVLLNRVDTSKAPDIEWPEVPDDVA
ncbi:MULTISPECIES: tail fiber assembly protein [Enterobacter cloacae complex]|uniref:tail fiber assembly protein n=1 Tax=Enterobacter cloacae complex TaxID=354276 RepID=UPI00203CEE39|nr:tail fiber assembly protein [Enterobacter hormaechei]HBK4663932.1 tail fiber assembly protein [Enterobacter hormaechei subsp. steigerwaltii]BDK37580.1 tail fiber protein [Enterobacter hormaechei]BDK42779.1 tail fiber protein [Enterobacter hormaechei]BDK47991.1 tail fiber protein [Enterobacter hormaechei]BDK53192.1 tail fiber protein [Enterobacter hormaechei]